MFRTNQNGTSTHRMVSIQEVPKGFQEDTKVTSNGGRPRSFVEVVREVTLGEGRSYNLKEAPQRAKRATHRPVVLSSNMENNEWFQKAWIGRLKNKGMFERVEEELKWVVDLEVNPCYWADDWIIFPYLDESKAARLINEEMANGSTPILELQKWSSSSPQSHMGPSMGTPAGCVGGGTHGEGVGGHRLDGGSGRKRGGTAADGRSANSDSDETKTGDPGDGAGHHRRS